MVPIYIIATVIQSVVAASLAPITAGHFVEYSSSSATGSASLHLSNRHNSSTEWCVVFTVENEYNFLVFGCSHGLFVCFFTFFSVRVMRYRAGGGRRPCKSVWFLMSG